MFEQNWETTSGSGSGMVHSVSAENGLEMLQREQLKKGIGCFAKTTQSQRQIHQHKDL